ncbi:MAG: CYTH domain-containing protein [Faecousia sp.]
MALSLARNRRKRVDAGGAMGREFELKYRADSEKIAAIRAEFGDFAEIAMETAYYDAPDGALRRRKWTLRRRYENGKSVCTLKIPLPDGGRGEWETECGDIREAIPKLCKLGGPKELLTLTGNSLAETCAARFTRLAKVLILENCTVELALDQGMLLGGGKELAFAEVEVELKSGEEAAAVSFAGTLAREFGLVPEHKSKVQRAMELAQP